MSRCTPARQSRSAFLVSSHRGRVVPRLLLILRSAGVSLYRGLRRGSVRRSGSTSEANWPRAQENDLNKRFRDTFKIVPLREPALTYQKRSASRFQWFLSLAAFPSVPFKVGLNRIHCQSSTHQVA